MPEGLEAEMWRRACAPLVGRRVVRVEVDDRVAPPGFADVVTGATMLGVRRRGKVVLLDTDDATIGLHFGMTGRLVVDDRAAIERLAYASGRDDPAWDRLRLFTNPTGTGAGGDPPALRFNDPRRLGRVSLDADLDDLGVDMFAVTPQRLGAALRGRRTAVKSALLDQRIVAGLGNLCADEVLWWASISPHRPAATIDPDEVGRLARSIRRRLPMMLERGGSTAGVLDPAARAAGGVCARDGSMLQRSTIGGRTAVWCPSHQR